jgi:hypothetical protein
MIRSNGLQAGKHTISVSPDPGGDIVRWSATQNALATGDIGMNVTTGRGQLFVSGSSQDIALLSDTNGTNDVEYLPEPESRVGGNSTRVAQTSLEGGSFFLVQHVEFNRIIFRITGGSFPTTVTLQLFQTLVGEPGAAVPRVAIVTAFALAASGTFEATPTEGTVTLVPGSAFLLVGRDAGVGSATFRTYSILSNDLINLNVAASTHPASYTTSIAATTTPATINTAVAPGGGLTSTTVDVVPVIRFRKA